MFVTAQVEPQPLAAIAMTANPAEEKVEAGGVDELAQQERV
jgi:hypothetical protein